MKLTIFGRTLSFSLFARDPIIASVFSNWKAAHPYPLGKDLTKYARDGYKANVVINACIREICASAAEPEFDPYMEDDGSGQEAQLDPKHPLCMILKRPNSEQSCYEFLYLLMMQLHIFGSAYIHKLRNKLGMPVELWLLNPACVRQIPDVDGSIKEYKFVVEGKSSPSIPPEDIIAFKFPDPLDDYNGLSPIEVLARMGDLDNNAVDYLRAFFMNGGAPQGILRLQGVADPDERKRIKTEWVEEHTGLKGWNSVSVMNQNVDYKEIGAKPGELQMDGIFGQTETRICSTFGVPPILIGCQTGLMRSTYANYQWARKSFWEETLIPLYTWISSKLTHGLASEYGDGLVIELDLSDVEALQENREKLRDYGRNGWNDGLLTKNEGRQLGGFDPVEGGDVFKEATTAVITPVAVPPKRLTEEDVEDLSEEQALRLPSHTHSHGRLLLPEPLEALSDQALATEPARAVLAVADRAMPALRNKINGLFKTMSDGVDEQALLHALEHHNLDAAVSAVPWEMMKALETAVTDTITDVMAKSGRAAGRALEITLEKREAHQVVPSFDLDNPRVKAWIAANTGKRIVEIDEATRRAVRDIIQRAFDEGLHPYDSAKQIKQIVGLTSRQAVAVDNYSARLEAQGASGDRLSKLTDRYAAKLRKYRSENIARTETMSASNAAQQELWEQAADAGLIDRAKTRRVWITMDDDRLCPLCEPLEGVTVGFREEFTSQSKKKLKLVKKS